MMEAVSGRLHQENVPSPTRPRISALGPTIAFLSACLQHDGCSGTFIQFYVGDDEKANYIIWRSDHHCDDYDCEYKNVECQQQHDVE
ncbi:uncharacterized protein PITG_00642 [Phytophthora infestans T30-4]|uniref:Uncharacterized protein n=1 Tax=Phytophthora infestans (strain T30-4) TaxID=403677 RepID=D0MRB4_PHYIT|nr:uncharacterized protein PITG_00642 [Phytophthora infestans T30-4]EEY58033.1 conserved hypothetical protein [Phytophthora infestans T30-4]|eukprot:XP_002909219.1 conserved hypothetical protein [Phytophthora infestans T30-4]